MLRIANLYVWKKRRYANYKSLYTGREHVLPLYMSLYMSMYMSLSKLQEIAMDREAWHTAAHGIPKGRTQLRD